MHDSGEHYPDADTMASKFCIGWVEGISLRGLPKRVGCVWLSFIMLEVMAMRGSRIAKQIIDEQRREAKRKQVILELRKRLLKERGESNGERTEFDTKQ